MPLPYHVYLDPNREYRGTFEMPDGSYRIERLKASSREEAEAEAKRIAPSISAPKA